MSDHIGVSPLTGVFFGGGDSSPEASKFALRAVQLAVEKAPGKPLNAVILPTARASEQSYHKANTWWTGEFGKLGVASEILTGFDGTPVDNAEQLLEHADIIAVPGGDTERMIRLWIQYGLAIPIVKAILRGCVVVGLSAGLIAWFARAHTDSDSYKGAPDAPFDYRMMDGLVTQILEALAAGTPDDSIPGELLPGAVCPHADDLAHTYTRNEKYRDTELTRRDHFVQLLEKEKVRRNGVAVDNLTALLIEDGYAVVLGLGRVTLHLWQDDELVEREFFNSMSFPLALLELTDA